MIVAFIAAIVIVIGRLSLLLCVERAAHEDNSERDA